MNHGPDPYARALADLDRMLADEGPRNERLMLEALADLGRVGRAGQRLADYLRQIAKDEPARRDAISHLLTAWNHAINH